MVAFFIVVVVLPLLPSSPRAPFFCHSRPPGTPRRSSVRPRERLSLGLLDLSPRRRGRAPRRASLGPRKRVRLGREHLHGRCQRRAPRRSTVGAVERLSLGRRDLPPRGQRGAPRRCCVDERERVPGAGLVCLISVGRGWLVGCLLLVGWLVGLLVCWSWRKHKTQPSKHFHTKVAWCFHSLSGLTDGLMRTHTKLLYHDTTQR